MSNAITTQNWPDPKRPGVPMFAERDGWHWLSNKPNETPFPAEWTHEDYSDAETEWFWDMGEEPEEAHEMAGLYYHGPCPFPNKKNIALSNIETLTDRARKNIVAASGARKMAKALSPILDDIDAAVATIRDQNSILTPTQINEMLAAERQWCADACRAMSCDAHYTKTQRDALEEAETAIRNLGAAP